MSLLELFQKHCNNLSNATNSHEIQVSNAWLTSLETLYPTSVLLELYFACLSAPSLLSNQQLQSTTGSGFWKSNRANGFVHGDLFICCSFLHRNIQRFDSHWKLIDLNKKRDLIQFLFTLPLRWFTSGLIRGQGPLIIQLSKVLSAILCVEIMSSTSPSAAHELIMILCDHYNPAEDSRTGFLKLQLLEQLPLELQNYVEANKLSGESISSSIHICLSSLESFLFTLFQNCSFAIAAELDSCKEETSISDLDLEFHYLNAIFCCLRAWNLFPIGLRGDSIGSVYELLSLRKWLVTSEQSVEQFPLVKLVIQTQNLLLRLVYGVKSYSSVCSEILGHIFEIQNNWINSSGIPEDVLHKSDIETTTNYDTYLQRAIVVQHVFWSLQGCWDITCQRPVTDWFFEAFSIKSINIFGSCLDNINIQQTMRVLQAQALSLSKDSSKSQALLFQLSELTCLLCEKHSYLLLDIRGQFIKSINSICFTANDSTALENHQRQVLATIVSLLTCVLCLQPLHVSALAFDVLLYFPRLVFPPISLLVKSNLEWASQLFRIAAVILQEIIFTQSAYSINLSTDDILTSECKLISHIDSSGIDDDEDEGKLEQLQSIQRYRIEAGQLHQLLFTNWNCETSIILQRANTIGDQLTNTLDMLRQQNTIRLLCTVREIECGLLLLYNVMDIAEDISISLHELKATTNQVKSSAFSSAKEEAARCSGVWLSILMNITLKIHEVNSSYEQASGEEKHFFLLIKRLLEMWSRAADLFTLPPSGIIILDNSGEISILPLVIHLIYLAIQVPSLIHVGTNTLWIILRSHLNRFSEISASICQNIIPVILSDSAVAVPLQRDTMLTEKLYQCIGMLISIIPSCDTSRQLLTDSVLPRITTQLQTSLQRLEECRIEKVFGIISTRESDVNDRKRTLKICSYHLSCMKGLIQGANFRKQVMEEDNSGESDDESDDCEQVLSNDNVDVDIFSSHIHSLVSGLLAMVEVIIKRNSCAILRRDEVESTCLLVDRIISVIAKLLESRDASLVLSEEIVHRLLLIFIDSNFPATEIPNLLIILVRQTSFTSLNGDTPSSSNPDQWTHQKLMQMLTAAILFQCDKFTFLIKSKDPLIGNSFVVDQCILYFSNCLKLVRQWSISQPVLIISNISTIIDKLGNFSNSNPALKIFGQCITAAIVNSNQSNLMSFSLVDIYLNSLAQLIELPNWIVFDANILRLMSSSLTTLEGCHHTLPADVKLVFATVVAQRCQAIISVSLQQLILQVDPRCNRMLSLVLDGLVCILYKSHDFSAHSQIFQILLEVGTQTVSRVFNRFMMSVAALAVEEQCNVSNIVAALFEEVHILLVDALAAPSAEPILSSIQSQPRTKQVSKWIALAKLNSVKDILAITKL